MGLANSSLEKHKEAVENFKKALALEPDNESYKSNLQIAEDKVGISLSFSSISYSLSRASLYILTSYFSRKSFSDPKFIKLNAESFQLRLYVDRLLKRIAVLRVSLQCFPGFTFSEFGRIRIRKKCDSGA